MRQRATPFIMLALCAALLCGCSRAPAGGAQMEPPAPTPTPAAEPSATPAPSNFPAPEPVPSDELCAYPTAPAEPEPSGPARVDLRAFCGTLFRGEDAPAMMEVDGRDMVDAYYPGLSSVPCEQSVIFMAAMSAVVCEIALVEVSDAKDISTVKGIFRDRINAQVDGGAWYPASIESWENNSRIVDHGNYIMMITWESCDDVVSRFNALF